MSSAAVVIYAAVRVNCKRIRCIIFITAQFGGTHDSVLLCTFLKFCERVINVCSVLIICITSVINFKAPITTAADDIHKYFSLFFRENKT